MATDFTYGGKQIVSGGPFKPGGKDMPSDARTRVDCYADIATIPNPYVGLKITVKVDETNNNKMTDYIVKSLKANSIGVANSLIDEVERYVDYLGVSSSGGGTGAGLTAEQAQQLQTAYEHSQSDHVTMDEVNAAISNAQLGGGEVDTTSFATDLSLTGSNLQLKNSQGNLIGNSIDLSIFGGSGFNLRDNSPLKIWAGTQEQYDALSSYDETIIYLIEGYVNTNPSEPSSNYSITKNLTNCSLSNSANSIVSGSSYESNVSINSGYVLSSISITMGGVNITSSAYSNGSITINSVTGDIVITIVANAETTTKTYTITNNLTNCSNSNSYINIDEGGAYNAVISANSGYELQTVTVTMGGNDVTSTAYSNGNITIDSVTGNIVITATAVLTSLTEAAYSLESELVLDGSSNVDTGISLFDADKDFTIIADFTPDSSMQNKTTTIQQCCVFRVKQTASPWVGVDISLYPSSNYSYPSRGDMITANNKYGWYMGKISSGVHTDSTDRLKFAIKRVASEQKMYFYDSNGLIGSYADSGNVASNTFATTLKIGGYADSSTQNFVGTVHKFYIYLSQLSNEEITTLLG